MMMSGFSGFERSFNLFFVFFFIVFALMLGVFIAAFVKGFATWRRNNNSPRLTVPATVVNKREELHRHRHSDTMHNHFVTTYYVTFEVESGDRMELQVVGEESGLMVEGDRGTLTFQGSRFLGFQRS